MKKVLFVVMPYHISVEGHKQIAYTAFPYGVLSIATYVKDIADVEIFDCNVQRGLTDELKAFTPDIVAISMMFDVSYEYLPLMLADVRKVVPDAKIVIGGMAATGSYKGILNEFPEIGAVCFHEGEIPIRDLVITGSFASCPAWITKKELDVGISPSKALVQNLDDVIDIDYSLIKWEDYGMREAFSPHSGKIKNPKQFYVVSSRGCKFSCTFCMHSADPDKSIRYASPERVIGHIRRLVSKFGCNIVTFYDDQFLLDKNRAKRILRGLSGVGLRIEFPNGLSTAFIDDEMACLMAQAGMDTAYLAIESGSPRILSLMKKPLHLEQVKPAVDSLHKYGIWCIGYFVTGYPSETDEERKMTTDLIKGCKLDWARFSTVCPLKGSELHRLCVDAGYIQKDAPIDMNRFIINTPWLSAQELEQKSYAMNLDVNFVNNLAMKDGKYMEAMREFLAVLDRDPNHGFALHGIECCAEALYDKVRKTDPEWIRWGNAFGC